jgi:flagellar biosynthesis protein FlhA
LLARLKEAIEALGPKLETSPVLLAPPGIRMHLRRFTERFMPDLVVLSHSEVLPSVQIKTLKVVSLNSA